MRTRFETAGLAAALTTILLLGAGCDAESASTADQTPADKADATVSGGSDVVVAAPDVPNPEPDVVATPDAQPGADAATPVPVVYPAGPYGTENFSVIEDLRFYDPFTESDVYLHDFHMDPAAKMLVISSSAGWCSACMLESEELVRFMDEYEDQGLRAIVTMYEDVQGQPIFQQPSTYVKDTAFMQDWKDRFKVDFPLVADPPWVMQNYWEPGGGTPLTMVITTDDMRIRYMDHGYSEAFLGYQILKYIKN